MEDRTSGSGFSHSLELIESPCLRNSRESSMPAIEEMFVPRLSRHVDRKRKSTFALSKCSHEAGRETRVLASILSSSHSFSSPSKRSRDEAFYKRFRNALPVAKSAMKYETGSVSGNYFRVYAFERSSSLRDPHFSQPRCCSGRLRKQLTSLPFAHRHRQLRYLTVMFNDPRDQSLPSTPFVTHRQPSAVSRFHIAQSRSRDNQPS